MEPSSSDDSVHPDTRPGCCIAGTFLGAAIGAVIGFVNLRPSSPTEGLAVFVAPIQTSFLGALIGFGIGLVFAIFWWPLGRASGMEPEAPTPKAKDRGSEVPKGPRKQKDS